MGIEEFLYYVKCEMCLMSTKKVLHSRKSLKDIWKELQNKSKINIKGKEINLCILHQDLNNNLFIYRMKNNYKPQSNKSNRKSGGCGCGANKTKNNVNSDDDLQKQEKKRKRKKDSSEEITLLPTLNEKKKKKKSISEIEEEQQEEEEQLNHNNQHQQQEEEEEEQLDDNNYDNNSPLDSEETQSFPNTEINIESLPQDQEQQRFKDDETVLFDNDCTEYFTDFNIIENNIDSNCKTEVDLLKEQVARLTEEKAIIQQNYDILLNHFRMHVFQGSQLVFRVDPSLQHLFQ
ncbi:hypothetical protein ABK040_006873 [Willaertia magna]